MSKSRINVSVVIPVRNGIATIERALASVIDQAEEEAVEVLVIDDGSTDGTPSLVSEKYPAVKLIGNSDRGVSAARNKGISHSAGRYIAFLDADDEWKGGKLAWQVDFLDRNPAYVLSASVADYVDESGRLIKVGHKRFDGAATNALINGNFIVTSSVMLRGSVVKQSNIRFNEGLSFAEDWQMWIRLSVLGKFHIISTPFVRYTCYSGRKYQRDFLYASLQKMVNSLKSDPALVQLIASRSAYIESIPELGRLGWTKQVEGNMAASLEAIKVLRAYPSRLVRIVQILL